MRIRLIVVALGLAAGCSTWSAPNETRSSPWSLQSPQMSPDSVVLEVALLPLNTPNAVADAADSPANASTDDATSESDRNEQRFWSQVDEQCLPSDVRRRLAANGFRAGRLDGPLLPCLQAMVDYQAQQRQTAGGNPDEESTSSLQRLQNRAGRRGKVLASHVRDSLSILLPDEGRLHGQTLEQAQCVFSIRSFPRGDGQVDVEITPEVEHGLPKQRWLGESAEGSFRINTSRERLEFDKLRVTPRLGPGQLFVLGPAFPLKGLGKQFFAEGPTGAIEPRVIVVRLAQTQLDDLFAPERSRAKLVTTGEE